MVATPLDVEWREIERTGLVEQIDTTLRAGRSVLLQGEAGVGKTTVARQAAPSESAWIRGIEGLMTEPLAAFSLVATDRPLDSIASAYRWLRGLAESGAVLVVDDAQWIDEASAALVAQVLTNERVRAILSVRAGHTMAPDLARALAAGTTEAITVEPLDRSMVELALELSLGTEPEESLVEVFTDRSGGNPLFLRELTLEAIASGTLTATSGTGWRLAADPPVSQSLTQLIEARLAHLAPPAREVVEIVAVAQRLPTRALLDLAGDDAVEHATRSGWLTETEDEIVPGHALTADVVCDGLGTLGRRRVLACLLDETDPTRIDEATRLRWELELERPIDDDRLDLGYTAAVAALDLDFAGRLARHAHDRSPTVGCGLRVANDLHRRGSHAQACDLVLSLRDHARHPSERALVASHLMRTQGPHGEWMETSVGRRDAADDTAHWADDALDGTPYQDLLAAYDALDEQPGTARHTVGAYLDHPIPIVRYDTHELCMYDAHRAGDQDDALTHALALLDADDAELADRPVDDPPLGVACSALALLGDNRRALDLAREHADRAAESSAPSVRAEHAYIRAAMCTNAGLVDEGLEAIAVGNAAAAGGTHRRGDLAYFAGVLLGLAGRFEDAQRSYDRAEQDSMTSEEREWILGFRLLLAALVDREAGIPRIRARLAELHDRPEAHSRLQLHKFLVQLDAAEPADVSELATLAADPTSYFGTVARAGRARLDHDIPALIDLADEFEEKGNYIDALETITAAINIAQHDGDTTRARALTARHRELHAKCPGLRWPLTAIPIDAPDLTKRERQVTELAALGWSNREIADELDLSVRTIENNLARAYTKLDVHRRADLATALALQAG